MMHRMTFTLTAISLAALFGVQSASAGNITAVEVERVAPNRISVRWADTDPVDIFVTDRPDAGVADATLVSGGDRDGKADVTTATPARTYFLLRDSRSGQLVRFSERVIPLERGSNFRDIGGYPAANGKHVRWGRIYRSGGTPLLSDTDVDRLKRLGLSHLIDLRSSEERAIAPTRLDGIDYAAVGYPMAAISNHSGDLTDIKAIYRGFPTLLAPQIRILFQTLLANEGALAYNCSAGQDRTGFATAIVLSALGVPRDVILSDYLLSTPNRRPEYEMPRIDPVAQASNPVAMYFAKFQQGPKASKPKPLFGADRLPYLIFALDEVERRWGSVDQYLQKEAGIGPADLQKLRVDYLE